MRSGRRESGIENGSGSPMRRQSNLKTALDLCQVIDKKNTGLIPKTNFDKITKMIGFEGENEASEHELMFSELVEKFTIKRDDGEQVLYSDLVQELTNDKGNWRETFATEEVYSN